MRIAIANDHAGQDLKLRIKKEFSQLAPTEFSLTDLGPSHSDSVDYTDYAEKVARAVANDQFEAGILICGSGIGMSITANKIAGIRAALCITPEFAKLSREHNDANVLCLAARVKPAADVDVVQNSLEIIRVWLSTPFSNAPRHQERIRKIARLES